MTIIRGKFNAIDTYCRVVMIDHCGKAAFMKFIVKVSPEITIKSRAVRIQFIQRLCGNIRKVFAVRDLSADVIKRWDMVEIVVDKKFEETDAALDIRGQAIAQALKEIPGIAHFFQASEFSLNDDSGTPALEQIGEAVGKLMTDKLGERSFAVRCKRHGEHDFRSSDVERYVGGVILAANKDSRVRLKQPDVTVSIEVKRERYFVSTQKVSGLGGYPIGSVGQVLSLISGGYDSCVASYQCIQRGMQVHYLFFNLGGLAHEVGVKQAAHYLWQRYGASHRVAFVNVPFEGVVQAILENVNNAYMGVVLKRLMMRAASQIAEEMKIPALVTGESMAQVSSQTIINLSLIDKATDHLVLRPLVASDKTQIIAQAVAVGVDQYAEHMPEYCAVISDKPTTAAKPELLLHEEEKIDAAVLSNAIAQRKVSGVDQVYEHSALLDNVVQVAVPKAGQVIIDIRNDDEIERRPLELIHNKTLAVPAYKINHTFATLDQEKSYLLYCERGVISKLHVAHLLAEGFNNVSVYCPGSSQGKV